MNSYLSNLHIILCINCPVEHTRKVVVMTDVLFQKFYLMEAGDTMYDFYTEIFEKVQCNMWRFLFFLFSTQSRILKSLISITFSRLLIVFLPVSGHSKPHAP